MRRSCRTSASSTCARPATSRLAFTRSRRTPASHVSRYALVSTSRRSTIPYHHTRTLAVLGISLLGPLPPP
eukprot:1056364-Rhodomonas_salina.1